MRGGLTGKGGPAGHKERPEETRGQKDWEGRGLRSGAGSPESRGRAEGAASPGAEATGSAYSGREGDAAERDSNSRQRTVLGEARGKKGF